jgi:hypothetical protein
LGEIRIIFVFSELFRGRDCLTVSELMKCEERSDWEIVQGVQGGEMDVFETLVLRHEKGIINLLYR